MTDADVDGSHIRTLLLTFFFRELPSLIMNGNIYIAQPPLYKLKKGKKEEYVLSDDELNKLILSNAVSGIEVKTNKKNKGLQGDGLLNTLMDYSQSLIVKDRVAKQAGTIAAQALSEHKHITKTEVNNKKKLENWVKSVSKAATKLAKTKGIKASTRLEFDDDGIGYIICKEEVNGVPQIGKIAVTFLKSEDYKVFENVQKSLNTLEGKITMLSGTDNTEYKDIQACLTQIITSSKRGQSISRYKGLGEMNPGQLWDTTLDPETRSLVQVTVEDEEDANLAFATLMGDEVAPRRAFIEENALNAGNIDI
jgi:DNA gyrase subunit B